MLTTFELRDVTFGDGGTASGFFTLDTTRYVPPHDLFVSLVAVHIVTTPGNQFSGTVYDSTLYWGAGEIVQPGSGPHDSNFISFNNLSLTDAMVFDFVSLSTIQPFPLTPTEGYPGEEFQVGTSYYWRNITSGELVPFATPIPTVRPVGTHVDADKALTVDAAHVCSPMTATPSQTTHYALRP